MASIQSIKGFLRELEDWMENADEDEYFDTGEAFQLLTDAKFLLSSIAEKIESEQ